MGQWHYTELGWHFTSPEPWGWACYHYGRWIKYRTLGWCWVPGREWAPAWVSWRTSPNHIGWSPLPPRVTWNHHSGIRHWADSRFNIGPSHYSFLRVEDFSSRNCRNSLISRRQNTSLMLSTVQVFFWRNYCYVPVFVILELLFSFSDPRSVFGRFELA